MELTRSFIFQPTQWNDAMGYAVVDNTNKLPRTMHLQNAEDMLFVYQIGVKNDVYPLFNCKTFKGLITKQTLLSFYLCKGFILLTRMLNILILKQNNIYFVV